MNVSRIDHVGVTVSDVERALRFYRDTLGLRVVNDSVLTSPEVAALLGLESVELRSVDLDSGDGRVFELLHYTSPAGNHVDYESRDPATGHIALTVDDLEAVRARIEAGGGRVISSAELHVSDPGGAFDGAICLYVRDPDGMILELVQRPQQRRDPDGG
jgi:catechol 2,3-dioxygenase-like lactoylglutathione lyase family enzyme